MRTSASLSLWKTLFLSVVLFGVVVVTAAKSWPAQFTLAGLGYMAAGAYVNRDGGRRGLLALAVVFAPWALMIYVDVSGGLLHVAPTTAVAPLGLVIGALAARARPAPARAVLATAAVLFVLGGAVGMPNWLAYVRSEFEYINGEYVRAAPDEAPALLAGLSETLSLLDRSGNPILPESWVGRTVVLDFWTTDCGVCYVRFPDVERFADRTDDVDVYAVHLPWGAAGVEEDRAEGAARYAAGGYGLPVVYSEATFGDVSEAFGFRGVPAMAVIDQEGVVRYVGHPQIGRLAFVDNLERIVDGVRSEARPARTDENDG